MSKQQNAVELLKSNLPSLFIDDSGHYQELFKHALQMEREQIIEAYIRSKTKEMPYGLDYINQIDSIKQQAEEYYNNTYGTSKSH